MRRQGRLQPSSPTWRLKWHLVFDKVRLALEEIIPMPTRELNLTLPEALALEAETIGLLQPEALERLIREEIRRRRVDQLFDAADRLVVSDQAPLIEAEVEAEIQAARAERRGGND